MHKKIVNFFSRKNHPYYLASPPYRQSSGGIRAMHYLCNALNQLGEEAYILTTPGGINPFLYTPELTPEIQAKHKAAKLIPISVYPEGIISNILRTQVVARWLLNKPTHLEKNNDAKEEELVFYWDEWIVEKDHHGNRLRIPIVDRRIFHPPRNNSTRRGYCFYAHKYLSDNYTVSQSIISGGTSLCLDIPRSPEEIAEILRRSETLYCYEPSSMVMEALMCGCPVAFVNTPYLDNFHWECPGIIRVSEDEVGSIKPPPIDQEAFDSQFNKVEEDGLADVLRFVELTQSAARNKATTSPSSVRESSSNTPITVNELWLNKAESTDEDAPNYGGTSPISRQPSDVFSLTNARAISDNYSGWLDKVSKARLPPRKYHDSNLITVIVRTKTSTLHLLANTLDSLAKDTSESWQLIIISDFANPFDQECIECIHWINSAASDNVKLIVDQTVTRLKSRWVVEIPPGTVVSPYLFSHLADAVDNDAVAIFFDDDFYDDQGRRHSPRFKPGVNPELLRSQDLAGPLFVKHRYWLEAGGSWQDSEASWFHKLLEISHKYGWKSLKHIPHVLISFAEGYRSNLDACLVALEQQILKQGQDASISLINDNAWAILNTLNTPKPTVEIFVYTKGDPGLLDRCLKSITDKTTYDIFNICIILDSKELDQDLQTWLCETQKTHCYRLVVENNLAGSFPKLANRAIISSTADFSLFINDESVIIQSEWLEELVRACSQDGVAGASPRLLKPGSGQLESTGYVLGLINWRASAYYGKRNSTSANQVDWINCARDITTLTSACFLVSNQLVVSAGLFDEDSYNDQISVADLSLRMFSKGYRLLYAPRSNVIGDSEQPPPLDASFESQSNFFLNRRNNLEKFKERWWPDYANDPFWNKNLSLKEDLPTIELAYYPDWYVEDTEKPKILAHALGNAQGDYRINTALHALRKQQRVSTCIWEQKFFTDPRYHTPSELSRLNPDVHIVQHYIHDRALAAMDEWYKLRKRPFTVYSLDDVITNLAPSNPFFKNFSSHSRGRLKYALARCDRMVVSTDFLAELYKHLITDIRVVPNRLEMERWLPLRPQKRTAKKPRIGWSGGTTHQQDLLLLEEVIKQTRDEADWIFFGMCPNEIRPLVAETYPFVALSDYPALLASLNFDIGVAPLANTLFNRGKSNLRLLELGILGLPVVCSDIDPYRGSPACLVDNTVKSWVSALRERIHDANGREEEGRRMRRWVMEHFLLENHLDQWLAAHMPD